MISNKDKKEFLGMIIDIFEDFLDEKGVKLDNPEIQEAIDEGSDADDLAIIFGSDYDWLEVRLINLLTCWNIIEPEKMQFKLGKIVYTSGICNKMDEDNNFAIFILKAFERYIAKDWGDLSIEDMQSNDHAVKNGERILAAYKYNDDITVWIITEWDRSVTTFLFPGEY